MSFFLPFFFFEGVPYHLIRVQPRAIIGVHLLFRPHLQTPDQILEVVQEITIDQELDLPGLHGSRLLLDATVPLRIFTLRF